MRYDAIYDDFEGDEDGRDVQLTIDTEVDEDWWIFDLHCLYMYLGLLTLKKIIFENLTPGVSY